ncbi:hypothetical protein LWI28_016668 [Acer negundo]|uniref:MULE transposase domain-containing protein n=1 Tax=Acer negundo TaxID=4023 RepID=A0AAD5JJZ6_ACENE|nr:hypothetical protein LWI28_016668 [Acer negundo]
MSIMDLDKMCEKLGYEDHAFYWYVTHGKSIENGLVKLKGHDDITRMLKELAGDRKVTVLFEHFRGVNRRKAPSEGSFVPIEEEEVLAKQGGVTAGSEGLGEQEGVEETEATIHIEDVLYKDAWSSDSDSSIDFDDDFEEPEYMETFEDEEVEVQVQGVIFDKPNANVEEQNEEPVVNDGELDDEQMQALRELRRLNRKRNSQRTKLRPKYELYDGVFELKDVKLEVGQVFASSKVFKEAAKEYAIRCGRVIWFPCSEKGRVKGIFKELKKTNPEFTVVINTELGLDDKNKFKRIYICFNACKQGWLHGCRKIIGLDACHVKSYHKAQLMWAIGIDADNGYHPIAYGVVEKEWHENWSWFLKLLKEDMNLEDSLGITFMIDRQKGLVESIGDIWPNREH